MVIKKLSNLFKIVILLSTIWCEHCYSQSKMVNLNVQKSFIGKPLLSVGLLLPSRQEYRYYETGITVKIPSEENYYYGLYGCVYVNIIPLFRPGFVTGFGIVKENTIMTAKTYYGTTVQIGIINLMVTSMGVGGGISVSL